jgi:spore photoproduct lyase
MTALSAPLRCRLWTPKHVVVTKSAAEHPHAAEILRRVAVAGIDDVEFLRGDRITGLREEDERATYARAKATLAVVVSPPSKRRRQSIPPSADWRLDLAEGCPAHCQYCYLAGLLAGPPVTRVYADLDEILAGMDTYVGTGRVTSGTAERGHEGTTFEASCYTDPLGIEHLTGSLAATIAHVGTHEFPGPVQLRVTTKFGGVAGLLDLPHGGRTRIRASVNSAAVASRFEGGTDPVPVRLPAHSAGDGPRAALTEVWQVRRGQVRVPGRVDDRAAHLVRDRPGRPPPRRPPPLLDLIHARVATNLHASRHDRARESA